MPATPGTIDIVWSAYRSVLSGRRLSYLSAPITSGKRALEAAAAGVSKGQIIKENIARGNDLAREIVRTTGGPIVAPTIFDAQPQGWSQADYMQMWLGMIEENVGDVYMSPGWSYSNGCAEEYLKAVNMAHGFGKRTDIVPKKPDGSVLHLHEGMAEVAEALHLMQERGVKADTLASVLLGLYSAHMAWRIPDVMHDLPRNYNAEIVDGASTDAVSAVMRDSALLLRRVYDWTGQVHVTMNDGAVRIISAWPEGVVFDVIQEE